jgi:hypothetical protein
VTTTAHANRGKWLEAAVLSSIAMYERGGGVWVRKQNVRSGMRRDGSFYREQATVDFMGAVSPYPIAFDCKVCARPRLPRTNTPPHQIAELKLARAAGSVAFLLVAFETGGVYCADVDWYVAKLADRGSVTLVDFVAGSVGLQPVVEVERGAVPVHFAPAVRELARRMGL